MACEEEYKVTLDVEKRSQGLYSSIEAIKTKFGYDDKALVEFYENTIKVGDYSTFEKIVEDFEEKLRKINENIDRWATSAKYKYYELRSALDQDHSAYANACAAYERVFNSYKPFEDVYDGRELVKTAAECEADAKAKASAEKERIWNAEKWQG